MFIVYDNLGHMPGCYALISPVTSLIFDAEDIDSSLTAIAGFQRDVIVVDTPHG